MKRVEKGGEGTEEKEETLGEKLKRVVGKRRGGNSTPVLPFWRLLQFQSAQDSVSARKLAATFWELHSYNNKMNLPGVSGGGGGGHNHPPRLRRLHHHGRRGHNNHFYEDKDGLLDEHLDPSPSSPDLPGSAIQPVSPASYGSSSLEVAPYTPAVTPTSSIGFKGRIGEPSYNLKTSTELLKVLNRIWSLEEQHSSHISLVRALKKELDQARSRIKKLLRYQQADRREIDELMKQIAEDKFAGKSKEQDRLTTSMQSTRDELEDERKLRKRSESLHRKLARELYEVKTSFGIALTELDKEKKSRMLLEDLCDEFAWGIRDYEQELHDLRQKCDKDWAERAAHDRLILHISESWLDERMQMKLGPQRNSGNKASVVDKLSSEIEAFLQSKRSSRSVMNNKNVLESTPLNIGVSAPQHEDDEDGSPGSDSHCFELRKPTAVDLEASEDNIPENDIHQADQQSRTKKPLSSDEKKTRGRSPTSLQVMFEEHMAQTISLNENTKDIDHGKSHDRIPVDYGQASGSNAVWRSRPSPVRQWTEKLPSHELEISESSSSILPPDFKENTLKAKLIEARARGQRSRTRLKGSKNSF